MQVRSNCHYCGYLCGFVAEVQDGRVVSLQPDPTRYPYDSKIVARCPRWRMNLDTLDGPDRLNYPLRRAGERGGGKWERVTWDEALDEIAAKMRELVSEHGPATVASAIGGPHATFWPLHRFMNQLGSPNNMGIGQICWNPRIWVDSLTFGWPVESDIDLASTGAIFLWATNPAVSDNSMFWDMLKKAVGKGIPLVVVDPRRTLTAKAATLHLAPFPGTDCALALGIAQQIVETGRIDEEFVGKWCHGFEGFAEHVSRYTPEVVERMTGVPAGDVSKAAEIFSQGSPTALVSGRGIDQMGPNTLPTLRALAALRAITGNVDRKGACVLNMMSGYVPEVDMEMSWTMPPSVRGAQLNASHSPLQSYDGYDGAIALTQTLGRRLPMRYLTSAHPNLVWRSMITGQPYKVSALIVQASNPLVTYANTHLVHEAMENLDLMVVLDYYMTPTAAMADFVLPSAAAFERSVFQAQGGVADVGYGGMRATQPYYERRCDYDFFRELGIRMGQADAWPQETLEEAFDAMMAPLGMTWEQFCEEGLHSGKTWYRKHEIRYPDSDRRWGFATTTGKVELRCEYMIALGATAYPEPVAVDDALDLELAASAGLSVEGGHVCGAAGSEPAARRGDGGQRRDPSVLRMVTGARTQPFWASSFFNNPRFRKMHEHPTASMSRKTLDDAGIEPGDWVEVSTTTGKARFVAEEAAMVDGVVSVEYGWWYPERDVSEPSLGGIWESNVNVLTSGDVETSEPLIGSWKYNGILCKVRKL